MAKQLTEKQKRFCDEYLIDLNATQAAIRAGYSPKTAYSMGQRLLKDVDLQAIIHQSMRERQKRTEITQDYVLSRLKEITDSAASDTPDSNLKYANQIKALELLGKHLGMFDKRGTEAQAAENNLMEAVTESIKALEVGLDDDL